MQDVLDEFNERHQEFGIESEGDIVSVSAMPPTTPGAKQATPTGELVDPKVEVVIVYWENAAADTDETIEERKAGLRGTSKSDTRPISHVTVTRKRT